MPTLDLTVDFSREFFFDRQARSDASRAVARLIDFYEADEPAIDATKYGR